MKISLLTVLQDSFTEKSYQSLAEHLAISAEQAKVGVLVIIPIILASILENNTARKSIHPIWWSALKEEYACKDDKTINVSIIKKPYFAIKGHGVSWNMFKYCYNDLALVVSERASIRKSNAQSLIEITTPLIACYLINWLEREDLKFEDLISNLLKTKREIIGALPGEISPVHLGITGAFFG